MKRLTGCVIKLIVRQLYLKYCPVGAGYHMGFSSVHRVTSVIERNWIWLLWQSGNYQLLYLPIRNLYLFGGNLCLFDLVYLKSLLFFIPCFDSTMSFWHKFITFIMNWNKIIISLLILGMNGIGLDFLVDTLMNIKLRVLEGRSK